MAVARNLTFPQESAPDVFVLTLAGFSARPGGTTPWASNIIHCEDVRMPEGYLALNRINFASDEYDLRLVGRSRDDQPWAPLLPALTQVASTATDISAAGSVAWDNSANPLAALEGMSTIAFPLVPQIRLEVHNFVDAFLPLNFAMAAWLLTDV